MGTPKPWVSAQILGFIRRYIRREGYPPTLAEISKAVNKSKSVVFYHLNILEENDLIERKPGKARAIKITQEGNRL